MIMTRRVSHRPVRRLATGFGLGMFGIYLAWNAYWLFQGRIPPSLLTGLTGLPAPTTGGTRSVLALLAGDPAGSLYYNPLTLPILAMVLLTLWQAARRGQASAWVGRGWVVVLLAAWLVKLLSPPATW